MNDKVASMQRFINNPDDLVDETVTSFVRAHRDLVRLDPANPRVVVSQAAPVSGKVGIVTGGGSGHEPAFIGYTGRNMVDAVAVGELFSSPTAKSFADAMRAADGGAGVAVLYGNYAGDNMNVKMAASMLEKEGIKVATVVANDDVCSAPPSEREKRRGVAGEIFMWKIAGAVAAKGGSLAEVQAAAQKAIDSVRSVGVGLGPCTLPAVGHPNFEIAAGTMEVGIGHHGEPGTRVEPLKSADEVAADMVAIVMDDHDLPAGSEVAVLVSGLGATPVNELYVLYDRMERELEARGATVYRAYVGNYFTSLEMIGATLSVMALDDDMKAFLDMEAAAPGFSQRGDTVPAIQPVAVEKGATVAATPVSAEKKPVSRAPETINGPSVKNAGNAAVIEEVAAVIVDNKAWLSEIDGKIGDGDHGINMAKGFGRASERIAGSEMTLDEAMSVLSDVLMSEIGGSMGPLYGLMFQEMASSIKERTAIDADAFSQMLNAGLAGVRSTGSAKVGDKTLIDTFVPAVEAFDAKKAEGFASALEAMADAAEKGRDSTVGLIARIGRASRLGERSRRVLDAGATSCCLILTELGNGFLRRLQG